MEAAPPGKVRVVKLYGGKRSSASARATRPSAVHAAPSDDHLHALAGAVAPHQHDAGEERADERQRHQHAEHRQQVGDHHHSRAGR